MTGPPAARPLPTDPGGFQARADGQQVEVRTFEGELVGMVSSSAADDMVSGQLADGMKHGLRLKLGIRWLPPRFDRPSGRPDLNVMQRRNPERYAALWRGTLDARVGRGSLGKRTDDRALRFAPAAGGSKKA
jgi:hypothetical protein